MKAGAIGGVGVVAAVVVAVAATPPELAAAAPRADAGGHPGFQEAKAGEAAAEAFMMGTEKRRENEYPKEATQRY